MTTVEREALAWAAGFFDGEGSTVGGTRGPRARAALIGIAQVERAELERFRRAVGGLGQIYGPLKGSTSRARESYAYRTTSFENTQAVLAMLWPWLGSSKRGQATKVLLDYREAQRRISGECRKGHAMTPENTCPDGRCRTCRRSGQRAYYHRDPVRSADQQRRYRERRRAA